MSTLIHITPILLSHGIFCLLSIIKATNPPSRLQFELTENQPKGIVIGNIRNSLKTHWKSKEAFIDVEPIEIVTEDSRKKHFLQINQISGDIVTARSIDREEVCSDSDTTFDISHVSDNDNARKQTQISSEGSNKKHTSQGADVDECQLNYIIALGEDFIHVVINILDENDCSPSFMDPTYSLQLRESTPLGSKFPLPTAKDLDSHRFGLREYQLAKYKPSKSSDFPHSESKVDDVIHYFEILQDTSNGHLLATLKLIRNLDWERCTKLVGVLEAIDRGGLVGRLQITVDVQDVNEHSPQWKNEPYKKTIKECTSEKEVFTLEAEDKDDEKTDNGRIQFIIAPHSMEYELIQSIFYITGKSLNVHPHKLLTAKKSGYQFYVSAVDGRGLGSDTMMKIDIEDCNNHEPFIDVKNRSLAVWENDVGVRLLTYVHVKDGDRGVNSHFSCTIVDNQRITLQEATSNMGPMDSKQYSKWAIYRLETRNDSVFDRETEKKSQVIIQCTDHGTPPLSSQINLSIHVADKNDNSPTFLKEPYHMTVPENSNHGTLIGMLFAADSDTGKNSLLEFSLSSLSKLFSINTEGEIHSLQMFDREKCDNYEFNVLVRDHGEPPLSSTSVVKVQVLDVNDNDPQISQNLSFTIVEAPGNALIHSPFGRLFATDPDLGENGTVDFRLKRISAAGVNVITDVYDVGQLQPQNDLFSVSQDGQLYVYGSIDREKASTYFLDVIAYDRGKPSRTSLATATVLVLDLNDNKPVFHLSPVLIQSGGILNVSVNTPSGTVVHQFEAEDPDLLENGSVSFHLMHPVRQTLSEIFLLHEDGKLIVQREPADSPLFERIGSMGLHTLVLKANDHGPGDTVLSSYFTLKIRFVTNSGSGGRHLSNALLKGDSHSRNNDSAMAAYYYLAAAIVALLLIAFCIILFFFYLRGHQWIYGDARGRYWPTKRNTEDNSSNVNVDSPHYRYNSHALNGPQKNTLLSTNESLSRSHPSIPLHILSGHLTMKPDNDNRKVGGVDPENGNYFTIQSNNNYQNLLFHNRNSSSSPYGTRSRVSPFKKNNSPCQHCQRADLSLSKTGPRKDQDYYSTNALLMTQNSISGVCNVPGCRCTKLHRQQSYEPPSVCNHCSRRRSFFNTSHGSSPSKGTPRSVPGNHSHENQEVSSQYKLPSSSDDVETDGISSCEPMYCTTRQVDRDNYGETPPPIVKTLSNSTNSPGSNILSSQRSASTQNSLFFQQLLDRPGKIPMNESSSQRLPNTNKKSSSSSCYMATSLV